MADIAISSGDKAPAGLSTAKPPEPVGGSAAAGDAAAGAGGKATKAGIPAGSEALLGVSGGEKEQGAGQSEDAPAGEGRDGRVFEVMGDHCCACKCSRRDIPFFCV